MFFFLSNMLSESQVKLSTPNAFDTDLQTQSDLGLPSLLQVYMQQYLWLVGFFWV